MHYLFSHISHSHNQHEFMAIKNMIGAPVTGDDFYGREQELKKAHRYLNERQSLLLSAPRRIGKSSLAKRLINDKTNQGWKCVYIDLQGIATKEAFLRKLIDSFTGVGLMEKAGAKTMDFLEATFNKIKGINFGEFKIDLNSQGQLESLFNRLADLFNHDNDTLIVIDELPLFLGKLMDTGGKNRNEIEFLLNWFRSIRQNENSHIRWLFCGSVGLRNFTNHYRMSQAINDLVDFDLGELPPDEAKGLFSELAQSYKLKINEDFIAEALNLLQWPIPYFIQLIIDRLISKIQKPETTPVTLKDIKEAISELSQSDKFITWAERLDEYRDLRSMAQAILDSMSTTEKGFSRDDLLRLVMKDQEPFQLEDIKKRLTTVLEMLEHDGYILRNGKYRKFRSPLLRKWWANKFVE